MASSTTNRPTATSSKTTSPACASRHGHTYTHANSASTITLVLGLAYLAVIAIAITAGHTIIATSGAALGQQPTSWAPSDGRNGACSQPLRVAKEDVLALGELPVLLTSGLR
jgi:hypothetical protein